MFQNDMREKINTIHEHETRIQELSNEMKQSKKLINDIITETSSKDQKKKDSNLLISQLKGKIDINEKQLQEMKRVNTKLDECNNEFRNKNRSAEKTLFDLQKRIAETDATVKDLEKKLSQMDEHYKTRGQTIEQKKADLEELSNQIQNKESELTLYKQKMDTDFQKLKTELSLYEDNFQNVKIKTKDLENKVLQLEEQISDLKLINNKLETDLEIKETTATQEKVKLQERLVEQSNDYASLFEKYESLEKEKETLPQMKKHLSFHSVLRQPQSDQAVSGILSLLQAEMPKSHLEVIQESERNEDNPLLVVLYNLSNLITEAKTAFSGIEAARNVALVVLHSKALKKPSKHVITEPDFKKLGIIVDMSFLTSKGIISNELTDDAIQQLVEFINRF